MKQLTAYLPASLEHIHIERGVAVPPAQPGACGVLWRAAPGHFWLDVPDIARYSVADGSSITIEPAPTADEREIQRILWMTPLAALLFQRRQLAFHAAAAVPPSTTVRGAIILAGDSGVGKSSLLAMLLQNGWRMLADELVFVESNGGGWNIHPSAPEIALWPDTLARLDMPAARLPAPLPNRRSHIAVNDQMIGTPMPLLAIYWLKVHNQNALEFCQISGVDRFKILSMMLYNNQIANALLDRASYFKQGSAIAQQIPIYRLARPRSIWSLDGLVDRLESEWL